MGRQGRERKRWEDKADRGRGGKTRQREEKVGRQHQEMDRPNPGKMQVVKFQITVLVNPDSE